MTTDPWESQGAEATTEGLRPEDLPVRQREEMYQIPAYATAAHVGRPRNLAEVKRRIMEAARLGGSAMYYGWGAGRSRIDGPSVKLANVLMSAWGNCAVEHYPVVETADAWYFTCRFVDLETGANRARPFRMSKSWVVHGDYDEARKDDIRFQIGASKAERNVICQCIPQFLIDEAITEARKGTRQRLEVYIRSNGKAAAVDHILRALARCGVSEQRALWKAGVGKKEGLGIEEIIALRADLDVIESGSEFAHIVFPEIGGDGEIIEPPATARQTEAAEAETKSEGDAQPRRGRRTNAEKFYEALQSESACQAMLAEIGAGDASLADVRQAIHDYCAENEMDLDVRGWSSMQISELKNHLRKILA